MSKLQPRLSIIMQIATMKELAHTFIYVYLGYTFIVLLNIMLDNCTTLYGTNMTFPIMVIKSACLSRCLTQCTLCGHHYRQTLPYLLRLWETAERPWYYAFLAAAAAHLSIDFIIGTALIIIITIYRPSASSSSSSYSWSFLVVMQACLTNWQRNTDC